jgi:hypothetical protein
MSSNERQVGGAHYRSPFQHWDWAIDTGQTYLEAATTKYITRWRAKEGVQDVQKAGHYLDKFIECLDAGRIQRHAPDERALLGLNDRFFKANRVTKLEQRICILMTIWPFKLTQEQGMFNLRSARILVTQLEEEAVAWEKEWSSKVRIKQPPGPTGMEHPYGYNEKDDA